MRIFAIVLGALLSNAALSATYIEIESEPGEWVFQGATIYGDTSDGTLSMASSLDGSQLFIDYVWNSGTNLNIRGSFDSGVNRLIAVDSYLNAINGFFLDQVEPSMEVTLVSSGRYCDSYGDFHIYEYAPQANPPRLALNFIQYCSNNVARGYVRLNSDFPKIDPHPVVAFELPPANPVEGQPFVLDASASEGTVAEIVTYNWEQISGPELLFRDTTAIQTSVEVNEAIPLGGTEVEVRLRVVDAQGNENSTSRRLRIDSKSDPQTWFRYVSGSLPPVNPESWPVNLENESLIDVAASFNGVTVFAYESVGDLTYHLSFSAPEGESLQVANYPNTVRIGTVEPSLDFSSHGIGCNAASGEFEVLQLTQNTEGLTSVLATFLYDCESQGNPIYGEIGWNQYSPNVPTIIFNVPASTQEGAMVTLDASQSFDDNGNIDSWQWIAPSAISLSSTESATPTFVAPDPGSLARSYSFSLLITDDEGYQRRDSVSILVEPLPEPPPADPESTNASGGGSASRGLLVFLLMFSLLCRISGKRDQRR